MSSSCLSRSASSFARHRIWRATSARRCSSSARRSSRPMLLCVSVGMVVDSQSSGCAIADTRAVCGLVRSPGHLTLRLTAQQTRNRYRPLTAATASGICRPVQQPAVARVSLLRWRGLRLRHVGFAHRGSPGDSSRAGVSLPSHGVMVCETISHGPPHVSHEWFGSGRV